MIPYGRQEVTDQDVDAIVEVLHSDFLTQGAAVPCFEKSLCDYTGVRYAVALNSCTSALHLACLALGLGAGDILWTSPITFVASANCALYCGASVDFVDVEPETALMSVDKLKEKLQQAEKEGALPKIVVPVHFAGQPCDMEQIHALGQKYGFSIIEDAAHAIGARYQGEPVGNCKYSDITVFSFHPVKIITTGEGGAALTNYSQYAEKMELLRSHGITRDPGKMTRKPDGSWCYEQIDLGFNYRMTDIQAALGVSQLVRLDDYVSRRHMLANRYEKMLIDIPLKPLWQSPDAYSAYHLYIVRCSSLVRNEIFEALRSAGIGVNIHYISVHTQPYYRQMGFLFGDFPVAEAYYAQTISLPLFPALSETEQDVVLSLLDGVLTALEDA